MLIGHQKQWQFLKKSVELDKLSHAYLFSGQEKLGKKTLALEQISLLFGENPWSHPDFVFVEPRENVIQISQIRDLAWQLSLKPFKAQLRVALVDQAHLMTEAAQNCFLKTLEEPKGRALLILITEYPERLLPTILSRCEIIKFYPVPKTEIESYLREKRIDNWKEILEISEGKPGLIIDFILHPQKVEERRQKIEELNQILSSDISLRFQRAKSLSQEPDLRKILNIWLSYFRDVLIGRGLASNMKNSYSLPKLKNIIRQIQNVNFLISTTNVNPRLALEILMLEL